jgi:hypothetical protein
MIETESHDLVPEAARAAGGGKATRTAARLANLGLAVLAFALALVTRADADLWGHLRFGLDILDSRQLTEIDPYSFTQDVPWVNHEWLSEVQMAAAYRYGGLAGLLVLKAAIIWFVFALIWRSLARAAVRVRLTVSAMVIVGTLHMTAVARPQLWTFLCSAILCRLLPSPSWRDRWWLPLVFVFWVNSHGGWIVGLGVVGVWAAGHVWIHPSTFRSWAALVSACILATLVNPYGWGMWGFIGGTVRMERAIDEWQSLWTTPVLNWVPWALAVAGTVWMWVRHTPHRLPVAAVLVMLAFAAARVLRIESLFVATAAILLAPALSVRWPRTQVPRMSRSAAFAISGTFLALAFTSSVWLGGRALSCVPITGPWAPDLEAMASLRHAEPGRIVTPFNWGEYAIWHLGPRVRVSMDGRRETIYSDRMLAANDAVVAGTPEGLHTLAEWNPEYVWLPASSQSTSAWLVSRGYRLDIETPSSTVLVRTDQPFLPPSLAAPAACFPG